MSRLESNEGNPADQQDDRLDSWKEIASFLHRDVRTVQRWEKTAGLPVHRHAATRLRTAFAYRSELETWWRTQRPALENVAHPDQRHADLRRLLGHAAVMAGVGLLILTVGVVALGFDQWRSGQPTGDTERSARPVSVLLTPLVDQSGDAETAALLDQAIAGHFGQQPGVEIAAPRRVARLLRLMRRDATRLTAAIGREVCVRGGSIRFVLAGRIHKLDSRYVVVFELIDPLDGSVRYSVERDAPDAGGLMRVVRQQIPRIATALVTMARNAPPPASRLEEVTTTSLGAVRLYTAAVQAGARREWAASELLARRALAADPQFAAASAWVGWAMAQQGRPRTEFLPFAAQAVAMGATTSDREAYLMAGMFHRLDGDLPKAAAAYEALQRLEPDDQHLLDLLVDTYSRAGQVERAATLAVSQAELRPNDFAANARAARALAIWQADDDGASKFVHRSHQLASKEAAAERPNVAAWLQALPVFRSWRSGDLHSAARTIETLEKRLDTGTRAERDALATAVGFSHLALGRLRQAEIAFRRTSADVRHVNLAMLALAIDDAPSARERLAQIADDSRRHPALFAAVGLESDADRGLKAFLDSEHAAGMAAITQGFIAARRAQDDLAVKSLRHGIELLRFSGEPEYFLAVEELARIWTAQGQLERAAGALESAASERGRTYNSAQWAGAYWIKLNVRLLTTYERLGRWPEADALRGTLARLLDGADAHHPFLKGLARKPRTPRQARATVP